MIKLGWFISLFVVAVGLISACQPVAHLSAVAEVEAPAPAEDEILGEAVAETKPQEIPASRQAADISIEIELNEEAMADFLDSDLTVTDSGLQYVIEEEGSGVIPKAGDVVRVQYTGWLADGTMFDSSYFDYEPFAFPLGQGFVIPGWDEGVSLLTVGSKAKFIIPPELAYGEFGIIGVIPSNATLYYDVELIDIVPPSPAAPLEVPEADFTIFTNGLKYYDIEEGYCTSPIPGQVVKVHYTGWLEDGTKFDSSRDQGIPLTFPFGRDYVIPGWDEGIASMKIGGKRQVVIPAELAFGAEGYGDVIPPNATLIYEIELLEIQALFHCDKPDVPVTY